VGCRVEPGLGCQTYEEYDLYIRDEDRGKTNVGPALSEFRGRLYVFWKTGTRPGAGSIVYTSSEGGQEWAEVETLKFSTSNSPAVVCFQDRLYLAYLNQSSEIMISAFDGNSWSQATTQRFPGSQSNATSPYPPSFSVSNNLLTMYWGGGQTTRDAVLYSELATRGITAPSGPFNSNSAAPKKIDGGKWQTKIGNTVASRSENQSVITTSKNGEISIASQHDFESRADLTKHASAAKSATTCGIALVPGYFGRTYGEEWGTVVVYRGFGTKSDMYEISIGRPKLQYEVREDQLKADVVRITAEKEKAEEEVRDLQQANQALQDQLAQAQQDAANLRNTVTNLQGQVGSLTSQLQTANNTIQTYKSDKNHIDQLRGILADLAANCDHKVFFILLNLLSFLGQLCEAQVGALQWKYPERPLFWMVCNLNISVVQPYSRVLYILHSKCEHSF
jgi:hypothetical protein